MMTEIYGHVNDLRVLPNLQTVLAAPDGDRQNISSRKTGTATQIVTRGPTPLVVQR